MVFQLFVIHKLLDDVDRLGFTAERRKVPLDNGARLFRVGTSAAATQAAIQLSSERRRLYDSGEYLPTIYLLAWARKDMLEWANQYSL